MTTDTHWPTRPPRPPGRPRSANADQLILSTTLRLLAELGYAGLSLEAVAAAAGVGKTTIYRRYRDKRELVVAAVSAIAADLRATPDSGDARADLIALLSRAQVVLAGAGLFAMAGTVLVEERRNPELLDRFRERVIAPNRARLRAVLDLATRRGQLRADADLDAAIDALAGALFAHHLTGPDGGPGWIEAIVDLIWNGIAVPASGEAPSPP